MEAHQHASTQQCQCSDIRINTDDLKPLPRLDARGKSEQPPVCAPSARSIVMLHPRDVHSTGNSQIPHETSGQRPSFLPFHFFASFLLSSPASLPILVAAPREAQGCWWFDERIAACPFIGRLFFFSPVGHSLFTTPTANSTNIPFWASDHSFFFSFLCFNSPCS